MEKRLKKNETAITLIALVVTIVVLLILAVISINILTGENGIIKQADNAKNETIHQTVVERVKLERNNYIIEQTTNNTAETFFSYLKKEGYIDNNGIVNTEELCGQKLELGNGNIDTGDVYIILKSDKEYTLNYYNSNNEEKVLWQIADTNAIKDTYNDELKSLKVGDFIIYIGKNGEEIEGIVLYDATSEYGLQVMLNAGTVVEYQNDTLEGWIDSYNNIIIDLVEKSKDFINPEYAINSRPLGSNPMNPYLEGDMKNVETYSGNYLLKGEDDNYIYDANVLSDLGLGDFPFYASRYVTQVEDCGDMCYDYGIRGYDTILRERSVYRQLRFWGSYKDTVEIGTYTVITLRGDLNIKGGDGSAPHPYHFHDIT